MPTISLTPSGQTVVGQTSTTVPIIVSLDTTVRVPTSAPQTCAAAVPAVLADRSLEAAYSVTTLLSTLNSFKEAITRSDADLSKAVDQTSTVNIGAYTDTNTVNNYLYALETVDIPLLQLAKTCVTEEVSSLSGGTAVVRTNAELEAQEQRTQESKSRLAAITAPETHTSYYESWFPRPMKQEALFGLFGTALLLLLASASIFLGMGGIEFQIIAPNWVFPAIDFSILTTRTPILLAGLGVGLILGVVGNYLKWF
jgi:hypothetical protein